MRRSLKVRMDGQIAVLAVAEKGSYDAAGEYLGVTRSAIRKRVGGIDQELGTPVFRSVGKRMVLTEAGVIYLPTARESVRNAHLGVDRVRAFVRAQSRDLRVGYSSHLNEKLLAVIAQLQPPGIQQKSGMCESMLTYQVAAKVLEGGLDIGFGFLPISDPNLSARWLMEEPLMLCLPAGHALSVKATIAPEELDGQPIIGVARKALPGRHNEIVHYFQSLGIPLKFVADAYLPKEALWMVSRGIGFALMTRSSAATSQASVVLRPFSDHLLTVKSGIFARRDRNEESVQQFIDMAWTETVALRPRTRKELKPH